MRRHSELPYTTQETETRTLHDLPRLSDSRWFTRAQIDVSHLISHSHAGARLSIGLQKGLYSLPDDPATPIVCIGPGTGVAPMRSLICERVASGVLSECLRASGGGH